MTVINFLNRLLGRPELLGNGYPDMADNLRDARIVNGDGLWIPPPPPVPLYNTQKESEEVPMVSEEIYSIKKKQVEPRQHPSSTSTLWCGTTEHYSSETIKKDDPLVLDHWPLKRMLTKLFPWILDVSEVRIRPKGGAINWGATNYVPGTIYFGPLEIHITVSPTHYSELMSPKIEKKVREKLYTEILPLITCMFENNSKDKPIIIFSPVPTETILEYI